MWGYAPENPAPTQQEMANFISKETGQSISRQTIARLLKKHDITRKKINYHYSEQLKHKDKISRFVEQIPFLFHSPILAIDECSFHLNEVPRYAYALKGMRANYRKPGKKGDNHTLILCISNQGVVHHELIPRGMKTKDFHQFLTNLKLPSEEKHHLLLDNLSVHRATKSCQKLKLSTIWELLVSKNIEPVYLPPYTPELNPVELCFNFLRQNTEKKKPRTFEELKTSIDKTIEALQQQDLTKYFQHCWDYLDENGDIAKKEKDDLFINRNKPCVSERSRAIKPDFLRSEIYPSWRWLKLGTKPTFKDLSSARKRIKHCIRKGRWNQRKEELLKEIWMKDKKTDYKKLRFLTFAY